MSTLDVGHTSSVLCIAEHDALFASGDEDSNLILWDEAGNVSSKIKVGNDAVTSICISKKRPEFFASSETNVYRYDTRNTKEVLNTYSVNQDEINKILLDPEEQYLATCDDSGAIKVINITDNRTLKPLKKHTNICSSIAFRPGKPNELVSGALDCSIIRWDFKRAKCLKQIDTNTIVTNNAVKMGFVINPPLCQTLDFNNDGSVLICGLDNAQICIFDTSQKGLSFIKTVIGHKNGVTQCHFPDFTSQDCFISGGNDGNVVIWDVVKCLQAELNGVHINDDDDGDGEENVDELVPQFNVNMQRKVIEHGGKVNAMTSSCKTGNKLFIGDLSNSITVYSIV